MPQRDPKAGEVKEGAVTGEQMLMTNQQPAELTKPSCSSFHCRTDASDRAEAEKCPQALPLMTHPGVGALTALAFVPTIGEAQRFQCGKQVGCYWGLVPFEDSSGDKRRLGHITKQGNSLLRCLWKRHELPAVGFQNGTGSTSTRRCGVGEKSQSRRGQETSGASVLDDAPRMELPASYEIPCARGRARTSPWFAVEHRVMEWAFHSSAKRSSK
jgi:hypothetical protein